MTDTLRGPDTHHAPVSPTLRESYLYDRSTIAEIQRAAREGIYDIRGFGAKRRVPHFDDLLVPGRVRLAIPLEGYRERCGTDVVVGARHASKPLHLKIPVTIAGMSFGALSWPAKEALGRGASEVGTSTTTWDGGMTPEERGHSDQLVYQLLPSRYGMNPDDLRKADAIEVVIGQGAKPGGGGMLSGTRSPTGSRRCATCRRASTSAPPPAARLDRARRPRDQDPGAAGDHRLGEADLRQGRRHPHLLRRAAGREGRRRRRGGRRHQGGTAATQDVFIEHVGIPTLPAIPLAVQALQELGVHREVQLIVSGGIRTGADVAKALALGADAVAIRGRRADRARRQRAGLDAAYRASGRQPATTTTTRRASTPAGSPPRTRSWLRGSTRSGAVGGSPTTCVC